METGGAEHAAPVGLFIKKFGGRGRNVKRYRKCF